MNREWMKFVDQSIRELFQRTAHVGVRQRGGGAGTGGGTTAQYWEIKESKAELSLSVDRWVMGLVQNDGATAEDGRRYYLNADGSAWICWTHLE